LLLLLNEKDHKEFQSRHQLPGQVLKPSWAILFLFEEQQLAKKAVLRLIGNDFILLPLFPDVWGLEYIQILYNIILTLYSLRAGFFSSPQSPEQPC
jgi:hypothetical protein